MINPKDYSEIVFDIIGAAMAVHRELNWGLLESVYNEALHLELLDRGIHNETEKHLPCYYKQHKLEKFFQLDLVVENDIIVELKSVQKLTRAHRSQLFNYMRLTKMPIGLLINFGQPSLQGERYAYFEESNACVVLDKEMDLVYPDDI
jgi:GxxExxY protein